MDTTTIFVEGVEVLGVYYSSGESSRGVDMVVSLGKKFMQPKGEDSIETLEENQCRRII